MPIRLQPKHRFPDGHNNLVGSRKSAEKVPKRALTKILIDIRASCSMCTNPRRSVPTFLPLPSCDFRRFYEFRSTELWTANDHWWSVIYCACGLCNWRINGGRQKQSEWNHRYRMDTPVFVCALLLSLDVLHWLRTFDPVISPIYILSRSSMIVLTLNIPRIITQVIRTLSNFSADRDILVFKSYYDSSE